MDKLLYVIILNYKGYDDTIHCIESVKASFYDNFRILVVDNSSCIDFKNQLLRQFPDVDYISTGSNLGFAGGNNIGICHAVSHGAEYICLLNNDTVIAPDTLDILTEPLNKGKAAITGPANLFWNSNLIYSTGMLINFYRGNAMALNHKVDIELISSDEIDCDYLEGTCLVFHRSLLDSIGYIPEVYFLYYEETEWCCLAKRKGLRILCLPEAKLWHKGSAEVSQISGLKLYFEDRNRLLFERRNAPIAAQFFFYGYFFLQFVFRCLTGKRSLKSLGAVRDGLCNRLNKNFQP